MLPALEDIAKAQTDHLEFVKDWSALMTSNEGQRVMAFLQRISNPSLSPAYFTPLRGDVVSARCTPEETHMQIGRKEVVSFLRLRVNLSAWITTQPDESQP